MIRAIVTRDGFPNDLIGEQEFVALPRAGERIAVMDRNANMHYLEVVMVRYAGIRPDAEMVELQRSSVQGLEVELVCRLDPVWSAAMSE